MQLLTISSKCRNFSQLKGGFPHQSRFKKNNTNIASLLSMKLFPISNNVPIYSALHMDSLCRIKVGIINTNGKGFHDWIQCEKTQQHLITYRFFLKKGQSISELQFSRFNEEESIAVHINKETNFILIQSTPFVLIFSQIQKESIKCVFNDIIQKQSSRDH